jgi:hypothetical protein
MQEVSIIVAGVKDAFSVSLMVKILAQLDEPVPFVAADHMDPVPVPTGQDPSTAPYVHSFKNYTVTSGPIERIMLSLYYYQYGTPGTSYYWIYDSTIGEWTLKFSDPGGSILTLPRNPMNITNLALDSTEVNDKKRLIGSDWDSDNGETATSNVTLWEMTDIDGYTVEDHLDYIYDENDLTDVAHCQDVLVTRDQDDNKRIFTLFIVTNSDYTVYKDSVLMEVVVTYSQSGKPSMEFIKNNQIKTIGKNARQIIPFVYNNRLLLFIPCVGGPYSTSNQGNLAASVLQVVDASTTTLQERVTLLTGENSSNPDFNNTVAGQDIVSIAISSAGNVVILTTLYKNSTVLQSKLYSLTIADLMEYVETSEPITNLTPIKEMSAKNSFFSALGTFRPSAAAADYFYYVYGTKDEEDEGYLPADAIVIWQDGTDISAGRVISTPQLTNGTSDDFSVNSIVVVLPGGITKIIRSIHLRAIGAPKPSISEPEEEA